MTLFRVLVSARMSISQIHKRWVLTTHTRKFTHLPPQLDLIAIIPVLQEKIVRSDLKSDVIRHLNRDDVVIFDAGNYIKGYRYEVYCATKSARVSQCTVFCAINDQQMRAFNQQRRSRSRDEDVAIVANNSAEPYTEDTLQALKMRFEEPQGNNRWDAPLFTLFPESTPNLEAIHKCLYEQGPPPPNQSTQNVSSHE